MPSIVTITLLLLIAALLLAFWRGGVWEKTIALVLLAGWLASSIMPFDKVNPPWGVILVDAAVFLILLYACLRSGRPWIIFAAAFQFLVLATHYVFIRNHALMQWAYVSAYYVWNLGLLLSLCCGAVLGRKSRAEGSNERREQQDYV